jgi:hypothetical protein
VIRATASEPEDRRHHEQQHEREAEAEAEQRERAAQPGEQQHDRDERERQHQHRPAALEVVERVAGARDRRLPLRRLGGFRHADVVARIEVGVEPAKRAQLELDPPAGAASAGQLGGHELAALIAEPRTGGLDDLEDLRLLGVHREAALDAGLGLSGPEDRQPRRGAHGEHHRHGGEGAFHGSTGSPSGRRATR